MITLQPMTSDDLSELQRLLPEWANQIEALAPIISGHAVSGWSYEKLLGCGGVHRDWSGAGRCWVILTPYAQIDMPVASVLTIRRYLAGVVAKEGYRRIEAHVSCDDPQAIKLLRVLGFRREGRCQQYMSDGSDAYMYAWLRNRRARKRLHGVP